MRIHFLQHVAFEGPAAIADWALQRGHQLSISRLFCAEHCVSPDRWDMLVVLGGPMGVCDERDYPWLVEEKRVIDQSIEQGKPVLGVCLGAQLIAHVLGAAVRRNPEREIGFFPVRSTAGATGSTLLGGLPREFEAFHWHGDTFDIPAGALHTHRSDGCFHQAFDYNGIAAGVQFHVESTPQSVAALIEHCSDELTTGRFVQPRAELESGCSKTPFLNATMRSLLGSFEKLFPPAGQAK